jgi:hypothetical protein
MTPLYPKPVRTRKSQGEPACTPNLRPKKDTKIAGIQGHKRVTLGLKRGNQHWFIFGRRQEQRALRGEGIRNPLDECLQILLPCRWQSQLIVSVDSVIQSLT